MFSDTGDSSCSTCRLVADELVGRVRPRRFVAGYLVGWRQWLTMPPGGGGPGRRAGLRSRRRPQHELAVRPGCLYSAHDGSEWLPGVRYEAACVAGHAHHVPCPQDCWEPAERQVGCGSCGVYAAKAYHQVAQFQVQAATAVGVVALWGRVEEEEYVYRGQYGYPLCLVQSTTSPGVYPELAELWGVPMLGLLQAVELYGDQAAA